MVTEIIWRVEDLECLSQVDSFEKIVHKIIWRVDAVNGHFNCYVGGVVEVTHNNNSDTYIQYDDLTEEIVVNWVKETLGIDKTKESEDTVTSLIDEDMETAQHPIELKISLPW